MSLLLMDGFDHYATSWNNVTSGVATTWITNPADANYTCIAGPGRWGDGNYLLVQNTAGSRGHSLIRYITRTDVNTFSLGCAVYVTSAAANTQQVVDHISFSTSFNSAMALGIRFNAGGDIQVRHGYASGGAQNGDGGSTTYSGVYPGYGTWFYFELEVNLDTTGGFYRIYVNGSLVGSLSTNLGGGYLKSMGFAVIWGASPIGEVAMRVDDVYLTDSATRLGEQRIQTFYPEADTDTLDWDVSAGSDHWSLVSEVPADGDTTYIESGDVEATDLFDLADLTENPLYINAVQVSINARKTDAGERTIVPVLSSAGDEIEGNTMYLSPTYRYSQTIFEDDPHTDEAWTFDAVNALQAGVRVSS